MNLPTTAKLPFRKTKAPSLDLDHRRVTTRNVQRRLEGRDAFFPDIDLDAYRFHAVVDWVEFAVHFGRATQVRAVQKICKRHLKRNCRIDRLDPQPGGTFTRCRIRVQEPPSLAKVHKLYTELVDAFGEAGPSLVTAIEISVDAYPKVPSDEARAKLLGALQRTIWTDRDIHTNEHSRPRSVFGKGSSCTYKLLPKPEDHGRGPNWFRSPAIDGTMYLGARTDGVMIRLMDKIIDTQNGSSFVALDDDEKRVRVEVSLQGAALQAIGLDDVPSLERMKFTELRQRFFEFRLPTFHQPGTSLRQRAATYLDMDRAEIYLKSGVTGLDVLDRARDKDGEQMRKDVLANLRAMGISAPSRWNGTRLALPFLVWDEMNRKFQVALKNLQKRETTQWKKATN